MPKYRAKTRATILSCLLFFQIFGVYLFLRGYLLTRVVVTDSTPVCHTRHTPTCPPRHFNRVVWLLIDALRYDFVFYNTSIKSDEAVPFYINRMSNVKDFLHHKPQNTKLFRFIADPPTTTMQRLKALTTGTLPTFIDISSNFNSYEIQEDNLIKQCKRHGLKVTFLGDDTWMGMYQNMFDRSFPFPSLNVKDLDTVDEGVFKHIIPELKEHTPDLVIGHFLGVDHCGHTYGPNNNIMRDKLIYIDNVIKSVFDTADNGTIVFVFGDHGMTSSGDHGGETEQETVAALLVYTPKPLFDITKSYGGSIYQTDLVPTVSLLLGIPIPFSNLGMIIPELFKPSTSSSNNLTISYLAALRTNCHQLNAFITAQSQISSDLSIDEVVTLQEMYQNLETKYTELNKEITSISEVTKLQEAYEIYMRMVRDLCVSTWAHFDVSMMATGVLILIVHLLVVIWSLNGLDLVNQLLSSLRLNWIDLVSFVITVFHSVALFSNSLVVYEGLMVNFFIQSLLLVLLLTKLKETISSFTQSHSWLESIGQLITASSQFIVIMICVRGSYYFHTCRDQQDDCLVPQLLQRPSTLLYSQDNYHKVVLLYAAQFLISYSVFVFALIYGEHFISRTFGEQYKQFALSKWSHWFIKCSFLFIFCNGIYIPDVVSVWLFRMYAFGTVAVFVLALVAPFYNTNKIPLKSNWSLAPYSWILLFLWVLICRLIVCSNQVLLIPLSLSIIQLITTVQSICKMPQVTVFTRTVICSLFSYQFFFGFGHQATITSLRFEAAFVGLYGDLTSFTLPIAGILVGINTLASQILFTCAIPLFSLYCKEFQFSGFQFAYTFIGSTKLLCSMVAAMILRRHLMIWAVFGPRFMYEISFQCMSNMLCILSYILVSYYDKLINNHDKLTTD